MRNTVRLLWFVLLVFLALASCESDNEPTYVGISGRIDNLPALDADYEYAAWLVENSNTRLIGPISSFNNDGTAFLAFAPIPQNIADARIIFFTIEEKDTEYESPSVLKILSCNFNDNDSANISNFPIASDFSIIDGSYLLDSPTTTGSSTDNSGIWFMTEDGNAGLTLPTLEPVWIYEGWVNFDGIWVSTGTFNSEKTKDNSNKYSGNEEGPNFPGEDFNNDTDAPSGVSFPMDLAGKDVKITIEPADDFDVETPFNLTILTATIPSPSVVGISQIMDSRVGDLPTGTMTKEQ